MGYVFQAWREHSVITVPVRNNLACRTDQGRAVMAMEIVAVNYHLVDAGHLQLARGDAGSASRMTVVKTASRTISATVPPH